MSTTNSIIAVVSLLVIFGISFGMNYTLQPQEICGEDVKCMISLINQTKNYDYCDGSIDADRCYTTFAWMEGNEFLCEKTSKPKNCYISHAVLYNKPEFCTNAIVHDKCIFDTAVNAQDYTICEKSQDKGICYYSYALVVQDTSLCDLSERYKSTCLAKLLG